MRRWRAWLVETLLFCESLEILESLRLLGSQMPKMTVGISVLGGALGGDSMSRAGVISLLGTHVGRNDKMRAERKGVAKGRRCDVGQLAVTRSILIHVSV